MAELTVGQVEWKKIVAQYARPDLRQAIWQVATSVIPYFVLFYLALRSVAISLWITVPLCILAAGFLTRSFIIFHDCGHGSFFKSQRANDWVGVITGLLTFTAYHNWKHAHAVHHATAGDLDRRGTGDVYTMTLEEYRKARWYVKVGYAVMRNPVAMFLIGAPLMFLLVERIPPRNGSREIAGVWWTNLAVVLIVTSMSLAFGWRAYLIVQGLTLYIGSICGVWLFYVQHQFRGCVLAATRGLELPGRQPAGKFFLQAAEADAVVQRKHRFPSHPSPEFEDPQLQPGAGVPGECAVRCEAADASGQPGVPEVARV